MKREIRLYGAISCTSNADEFSAKHSVQNRTKEFSYRFAQITSKGLTHENFQIPSFIELISFASVIYVKFAELVTGLELWEIRNRLFQLLACLTSCLVRILLINWKLIFKQAAVIIKLYFSIMVHKRRELR